MGSALEKLASNTTNGSERLYKIIAAIMNDDRAMRIERMKILHARKRDWLARLRADRAEENPGLW